MDPNNYPASSREDGGYDLDVARILAEELGAEVSIVWSLPGEVSVQQNLLAGECDVFFGVADGAAGMASTVPYYRAPFVFLYKSTSDFEIESLADEDLGRLRIGTYAGSLPHVALQNRGYQDQVTLALPARTAALSEPEDLLLDALREGEIDVAVLYGPVAGAFALTSPEEYRVVPVTPEIEPPFLQLFRIWTLGLRPGDEDFRDLLNLALAARWDEVQGVIQGYGVPLLGTPRPRLPVPVPGLLEVAVVSPNPTGLDLPMDAIGRSAQQGLRLADSHLGRSELGSSNFKVLHASAPTASAAARAVDRLALAHGVLGVVGGFGDDQAVTLSTAAEEHGILFFNAGSTSSDLRQMCHRMTFHVEASDAMYVDALVASSPDPTAKPWYLVFEDSDLGRRREALARTSLSMAGVRDEDVQRIPIEPGQVVFYDALTAIEGGRPGTVLVLLPTAYQEQFAVQFENFRLRLPVLMMPEPASQPRGFLIRLRQAGPTASAGTRVTLWEPSNSAEVPGGLNDDFVARTGAPLEPAAWATYASLRIMLETAAAAGGSSELTAAALERGDLEFHVGKEGPVSFRAWDHQLRQPLYLIEMDPGAPWGHQATDQIALARLMTAVPPPGSLDESEPAWIESLDQLGASSALNCRHAW